MSAEEERMLKLAIKNSLLEKKKPTLVPIPIDDTHESVLT